MNKYEHFKILGDQYPDICNISHIVNNFSAPSNIKLFNLLYFSLTLKEIKFVSYFFLRSIMTDLSPLARSPQNEIGIYINIKIVGLANLK